jgi:uncharacterized protein (TIGR02594 family)
MATLFDNPNWFAFAAHEIGTREEPGNKGPAIRHYIALAKAGTEGDPWCAIFANACLEACGVRGTRSASSQSFRRDPNFVKLDGPALGAIVVFYRGGRDSGLGHVGFYRGETANHIYTLGGNEGDMVQIEPMARAAGTFGLVGYYWPKDVPLPHISPVIMQAHAPAQQVSVT